MPSIVARFLSNKAQQIKQEKKLTYRGVPYNKPINMMMEWDSEWDQDLEKAIDLAQGR